jgi:hypothetical protein
MLDHYLHTAHRAATVLFPESIKLAGPHAGVIPEDACTVAAGRPP